MKFSWAIWFRPVVLILAALLASGIGALIFSTVKERDLYYFEVDATNERPGRIQVFYDTGHGFSQEESSIQPLSTQQGAVRYNFIIPRGKLYAIRLDLRDLNTNVTVAKPAVIDVRRREIRKFAISDIKPLEQVGITRIDNNSLTIVPDGIGPTLLIQLADVLTLGMTESDAVKQVFIPVWLAVFVLCWFSAGLLETVSLGFVFQLKALASNRPLTTIICTSALGVIIQCHPVIFFGKSFVSPDNSTHLLYDHSPTLPGYTLEDLEDAQGSDVAALLHGSLSYPSQERRALFRDREIPLWNRYSMGGLPLLGQGQSMFGSLLNFISIAGDSSAVSWDLRFVLSRWLYGLGLGIATWLLTRHLGAASFISFVGLFIGFFGFRLNHMAQLSVDLSPWILVGWAMLKNQQSARAAVLLFIANWEVMTSGTVKEAYMLILCLNFAGLFIIYISDFSLREKLTRIGIASLSGICLILISAPLWLVFLDSLGSGSTHYDVASVQQTPLWQILGFFDEMFYRRLKPGETHALPAVNFLVFGGLVWTVVGRDAWKQKACVAISLAILLPAFVAFGVIPGSLLMKIRFINNISHVNNTFSCPMLVLASVLAGFGFKALWVAAHQPYWGRSCTKFTAIVAGLLFFYYWGAIDPPGSSFYMALAGSLGLALLAGHIGLRSWAQGRNVGALVVGVGGAVFLTCWQHSQYLKTPADRYVFNPGQRIDLRAASDAVKHVNSVSANEPYRILGLGNNVFAGYSEMLYWESIYGVDPVRNADFDILCAAANMTKKDWGDPGSWHEDDLTIILPIQNLLNVRYYLATHTTTPTEIKGLQWMASHDLDLYESPGAWPRAFYTDRCTTYTQVDDFVALLRKNQNFHPFAALLSTEKPPGLSQAATDDADQNFVAPAYTYRLTTNTTQFTVDAPRSGLAVLAENYLSQDFRAFLNGKPVPYIRVNQSCKGVVIPEAGTYEVRFEYRPRRLTLALLLMSGGLLTAVVLLASRIYVKRASVIIDQNASYQMRLFVEPRAPG